MGLSGFIAGLKPMLQLCTPAGLVHAKSPTVIDGMFQNEPSVSCEELGSHFSNSSHVGELNSYIAERHDAVWAKVTSSGSTANIFAMLQFLARIGVKKIVMPEYSHISVWRAVQAYRLQPITTPCTVSYRFNTCLPPTIEALQERLYSAEAVILTSPVYDLVYPPVREWSEVVGSRRFFLVDAAWCRTPFTERLIPRDGAHIFTNSTHKLMGGLQGSSIIVASNMLNKEELTVLEDCWRSVTTTSPSFPIIASVELVYNCFHREPGLLDLPARFSQLLKDELLRRGFPVMDESSVKEVYPDSFWLESWKVHVALPTNGYKVKKILETGYGIVAEKAGPRDIQFVSSFRAVLPHSNSLHEIAGYVAESLEKAVNAAQISKPIHNSQHPSKL